MRNENQFDASINNIAVSQLVGFLEKHKCQRQVALTSHKRQSYPNGPPQTKSILDEGLAENGARFEKDIEKCLQESFDRAPCVEKLPLKGNTYVTLDALLDDFLATPTSDKIKGMYAAEVEVSSVVSHSDTMLHGRADFILVTGGSDSGVKQDVRSHHEARKPIIIILECKASRVVEPSHNLQLACYALMVQQQLDARTTRNSEAIPIVRGGVVVQGEQDKWELWFQRLTQPEDFQEGSSTSYLRSLEQLQTSLDSPLLGDKKMKHLMLHISKSLAYSSDFSHAVRKGRESSSHPISDSSLPLRGLPYQYTSMCNGCKVSSECLEAASSGRGDLQLLGCSNSLAVSLSTAAVNSSTSSSTSSTQPLCDIESLAEATEDGVHQEAHRISIQVLKLLRLRQLARLRRVHLTQHRQAMILKPLSELMLLPEATSLPSDLSCDNGFVRVFLYSYIDPQVQRIAGIASLIVPYSPPYSVVSQVRTKWMSTNAHGHSPAAASKDSETEANLLEDFSTSLREGMSEVAGGEKEKRHVHFFFVNRSNALALQRRCLDLQTFHEISALNELCSMLDIAIDSRSAVDHEQTMVSYIEEEAEARYATSWLGRDLATLIQMDWPCQSPCPPDVKEILQPLSSISKGSLDDLPVQVSVAFTSRTITSQVSKSSDLGKILLAHVKAMSWLESEMRHGGAILKQARVEASEHHLSCSLLKQSDKELADFVPQSLKKKFPITVASIFSNVGLPSTISTDPALNLFKAAADVVQLESVATMDRWFMEMAVSSPPALRILEGSSFAAKVIDEGKGLNADKVLVVQLVNTGLIHKTMNELWKAIRKQKKEDSSFRVTTLKDPDSALSLPQPLLLWYEETGIEPSKGGSVTSVVAKIKELRKTVYSPGQPITRAVAARLVKEGNFAIKLTLQMDKYHQHTKYPLNRYILMGAKSVARLRSDKYVMIDPRPDRYVMLDPVPDIGGWVAGRVLPSLTNSFSVSATEESKSWARLLVHCLPHQSDSQHVEAEIARAFIESNISEGRNEAKESSDNLIQARDCNLKSCFSPAGMTLAVSSTSYGLPAATQKKCFEQGSTSAVSFPQTPFVATPAASDQDADTSTPKYRQLSHSSSLASTTSTYDYCDTSTVEKGQNITMSRRPLFLAANLELHLERIKGRYKERMQSEDAAVEKFFLDSADVQFTAIAAGWRQSAALQLLQGPPGTGKTEACALAALTYSCAMMQQMQEEQNEQEALILITANTNTGVENIMNRVQTLRNGGLLDYDGGPLSALCKQNELELVLLKSSQKDEKPNPFKPQARSSLRAKKVHRIRIVCGTVTQLLKYAAKAVGLRCLLGNFLIADEASQMPFPHLLALCTLLHHPATTVSGPHELKEHPLNHEGGETGPHAWGSAILVAGDHRQLDIISSHNWKIETKSCSEKWHANKSAYAFLQQAAAANDQGPVVHCRLSFTLRLPPLLILLISPFYKLDGVMLKGITKSNQTEPEVFSDHWIMDASATSNSRFNPVWNGQEGGLFVLRHTESSSVKKNISEVNLVVSVLKAMPDSEKRAMQESGGKGVFVISPHRAQCFALQETLCPRFIEKDLGLLGQSPVTVNTVDKFQGDEARTIIYSATVSDMSEMMKKQDFYLNAARANVPFSRAKVRLIVIVSNSFLEYTSASSGSSACGPHAEGLALWQHLQELVGIQNETLQSAPLHGSLSIFGKYY